MIRLFRALVAGLTFIISAGSLTDAFADTNALSYVSGVGDDANTCTRPIDEAAGGKPCRTFSHVLSVTEDKGVVICADAGNFQPFNITQSVTIDCRAGGGSENAAFIGINAPGKTVRIRNLTVNGLGVGLIGIVISAAASVELDNVNVYGGNIGISDQRTGPGKLSIRNSTISSSINNSGSPMPGIVISPFGGSLINVVLDHVTLRDNSYGLAVAKGGRVMAIHSTFSQNSVAGVESDTGGIVEIHDAIISNNTTGIIVSAGAAVSISNASVESNNTGISGAIQSFGNNRFIRNAVSDGTPPTPFGAASSENGQR